MTEIKLKTSDFLNYILLPACKLNNVLTLRLVKESSILKTSILTDDCSVAMFANINVVYVSDDGSDESVFTLPDVNALTKLVYQIPKDENFKLTFRQNALIYNSPNFSFKYHLLENSLSNKSSLKEEKVTSLKYSTEFIYTEEIHKKVLNFSRLFANTEKCYIYTEGESVYATVGNKGIPNTNEIKVHVAQTFEGEKISSSDPFVVSFDSLNRLSFGDDFLIASFNLDFKLILFKNKSNNLFFTVSCLVD